MRHVIRVVLVLVLTVLDYIVTPRIVAVDHDALPKAAGHADEQAEKREQVAV